VFNDLKFLLQNEILIEYLMHCNEFAQVTDILMEEERNAQLGRSKYFPKSKNDTISQNVSETILL
jgi:DNA primase